MPWEEIVAELAGMLDLPELRLDGSGRTALLVDGRTTVELAASPRELVAFSRLGRIADFAREDAFAAMLAANLPDGGLDGARLGFDGEEAVLIQSFPSAVGAEGVAEGLAGFVDAAETWRRRLNG